MPNIVINSKCNLNCSYCFSNKTSFDDITIQQLNEILNYLKKTKISYLNIIGGEPSIHPEILQIIELIANFTHIHCYNKTPLMFTNGINLYNLDSNILNKINLLININNLKKIDNNKFNQLILSLEFLKKNHFFKNNKVFFGFNIYPDMTNYNFIFELAKQYRISSLRCACVAPPEHLFNLKNKEQYFIKEKEIFLNCCYQALINNIILDLDCTQIPLCYFTKEEKILLSQTCKHFSHFCSPIIDIYPNLTAKCCFALDNIVQLSKFENLDFVNRYFLFNDIYNNTKLNLDNKCQKCDKFQNFCCQGGCLIFAKYNN